MRKLIYVLIIFNFINLNSMEIDQQDNLQNSSTFFDIQEKEIVIDIDKIKESKVLIVKNKNNITERKTLYSKLDRIEKNGYANSTISVILAFLLLANFFYLVSTK